ncbi:Hypothetical predicted protein [Pelobates cultripes]|uniref:Uncharacterized protein n=1 Tax=Pelobates cultripes TaxID=61616 RepID=A0AAD1S0Q9_PELCU|nr:Hypothetical predicted protein [Pelobates cultripes]
MLLPVLQYKQCVSVSLFPIGSTIQSQKESGVRECGRVLAIVSGALYLSVLTERECLYNQCKEPHKALSLPYRCIHHKILQPLNRSRHQCSTIIHPMCLLHHSLISPIQAMYPLDRTTCLIHLLLRPQHKIP